MVSSGISVRALLNSLFGYQKRDRVSNLVLSVAIFCTYLTYYLHGLGNGIDPIDEGIVAYAANLVADGAVLYRDVFVNWGPGKIWLISVVFYALGRSLFIARLVGAVTAAFLGTVSFILLNRLTSRWIALLASLYWLVLTGRFVTHLIEVTNFIFSGLALLILCNLAEKSSSRTKDHLFLGLLVGLCALFQTIDGVAIALVVTAFVILRWALKRRLMEKTTILEVSYLFIGSGIILVPTALYFAAHASLSDLVYALVFYNLETTHSGLLSRGASQAPFLTDLFINLSPELVVTMYVWYFPYIALALGVLTVLKSMLRRNRAWIKIAPVLAYAFLIFPAHFRRPDSWHLILQSYFGIVLLLGVIVENSTKFFLKLFNTASSKIVNRKLQLALRAFSLPAILVSYLLLVGPVTYGVESYLHEQSKQSSLYFLSLPRGHIYGPPHIILGLLEATHFIESNVRVGESVLVLPCYPIVNFLSNRRSPSPYTWFLPWSSSQEMQNATIWALASNEVEYVLLSLDFIGVQWGGDENSYGYANSLMFYIKEHYTVIRILRPDWVVLIRNSTSNFDPMIALLSVYVAWPDLQQAFPTVYDGNMSPLIKWAATSGATSEPTSEVLSQFADWYRAHSNSTFDVAR